MLSIRAIIGVYGQFWFLLQITVAERDCDGEGEGRGRGRTGRESKEGDKRESDRKMREKKKEGMR